MKIHSGGIGVLQTTDPLAGTEGTICYRVDVAFRPADGSAARRFSSNVVCLSPELLVYLPTALNPNSTFAENRTWRPFFNGPFSGQDYQLRVFDRYGGLLFESDDPERGWDGRAADGRQLPGGVYVFALWYRTREGAEVIRGGDIHLLR